MRSGMFTCLSGFIDATESIEEVGEAKAKQRYHASLSGGDGGIRSQGEALATYSFASLPPTSAAVTVLDLSQPNLPSMFYPQAGSVSILGSQPWPIGRGGSSELMIGCLAKAECDDIVVDNDEVSRPAKTNRMAPSMLRYKLGYKRVISG
eukprot:scaffold35089_cov46-Prasinocladus_malaysianus.AAC.1